eukprot:5925400-Prymnesium_polylepis.1
MTFRSRTSRSCRREPTRAARHFARACARAHTPLAEPSGDEPCGHAPSGNTHPLPCHVGRNCVCCSSTHNQHTQPAHATNTRNQHTQPARPPATTPS